MESDFIYNVLIGLESNDMLFDSNQSENCKYNHIKSYTILKINYIFSIIRNTRGSKKNVEKY